MFVVLTLLTMNTTEFTMLGAPLVGLMATNEAKLVLMYFKVKLPTQVRLRPQPDDKSAT